MTVFVHINTFYVLSHCKNNGEGGVGSGCCPNNSLLKEIGQLMMIFNQKKMIK